MKEIKSKKMQLLSNIDNPEFRSLSAEFIELLRASKFKPEFEGRKEQNLNDAQNLFGYYSYNPSEQTKTEVRKEINSLLYCIDSEYTIP